MQDSRPRLKIPLAFADKIMNTLSISGIVFLWIYMAIQYASLPEIIPTHFNFSGKADDYGSKATLFLIPSIITIVCTIMLLLTRVPHTFNYIKKITETNAFDEYRRAARLIRIITLIIVVFFMIISFDIVLSARKGSSALTWWIIPVFIIAMLMPVFISVFQFRKKKQM